MISKKDFILAINQLRQHQQRIEMINDAFDTVIDFDTLDDLVVSLLEKLMNLEPDEVYGTTLSWWIWELDFGRKWKEYPLVVDGEQIDLSTTEKLYDFLTTS